MVKPGDAQLPLIVAKYYTPSTLLVWPVRQICVECGAEWYMAGIFPLTEWQMPAGYVVEECEGRGEDPRPHAFLVGL
jgi:hypothetical protein